MGHVTWLSCPRGVWRARGGEDIKGGSSLDQISYLQLHESTSTLILPSTISYHHVLQKRYLQRCFVSQTLCPGISLFLTLILLAFIGNRLISSLNPKFGKYLKVTLDPDPRQNRNSSLVLVIVWWFGPTPNSNSNTLSLTTNV